MNTVGIVALSLLAGLFIALLIGTSAWLIWIGLQYKRTVAATTTTLAAHREEWTNTLNQLRTTLESHRAQTDASIKLINGEKLSSAVERLEVLVKYITQVAQRNERAAIAIGKFVQEIINMPDASDTITAGVGTDGYASAEPGEQFISRSRTSADDALALADESASVTGTADTLGTPE